MKRLTLIALLAAFLTINTAPVFAGDNGKIKEHHYKWSEEILERQEAEIEAKLDAQEQRLKNTLKMQRNRLLYLERQQRKRLKKGLVSQICGLS